MTKFTGTQIRTPQQLVTIFWLTVDILAVDDCWLWRGYTEKGYGRVFDGTRMRAAHDLALEWFSGEPRPPGLDTCHSCNIPACVNPHHLRYDTRSSNVQDMLRAGRGNFIRKLSDATVVLIRERREAGATGRSLAKQYGVSESCITEIIRGHDRVKAGGPIRTTHGNRKAP